ncbi:TPA: helix-turn-helix domain-containing protein [Pseudomonas aeruginosa]
MSVTTSADEDLIAAADWIQMYIARQPSDPEDTEMPQIVLSNDTGSESVSVPVPNLALRLFGEVLRALGEGSFVMLDSLPAEMTLTAAAQTLHISRGDLIKLVNSGDIPHVGIGRHRRIKLVDLVDYQEVRNKRSYAALDELSDQAQDLGMGYAEGEGPSD